MEINEKISLEAREIMKQEIQNVEGREIFFRGIPDENGVVTQVEIVARGNEYSVPAILRRMKRKEVIIHNHPSGFLYPSDADIEVASTYANESSGGSYIINNEVDKMFEIIPLILESEKKIDIAGYFEKNGLLAQYFKEFEYRDEQLQMAKHIENGINNDKITVIEAGTGTGKTLAYLIPAIQWCIDNQKRAVISTNTIALQEQLLNKDIPIAKKVIGKEFRYTLVKGRGNYLCNRKYYQNLNVSPAQLSENINIDNFSYILKWGKETETGDKSEHLIEVDYDTWELFQSETDMCLGGKCPYRKECYFFRAKEERKKSDILIVNHHLFFSDLAIRKEAGFNTEYSIIPEYNLLVFDEAHNIEKVARDYFSYEISRLSFTKAMNQIYSDEKKKTVTGALVNLNNYIKEEDSYSIYENLIKELVQKHKELLKIGVEYFMKVIELFGEKKGAISFRIKKDSGESSSIFTKLERDKERFLNSYTSYFKSLSDLKRAVKDLDDREGRILEFTKFTDRLEGFFNNFRFINSIGEEDFIYWLNINERHTNAKFVATPLLVDKELQSNLYLYLNRIVFTSATIAIENNFEYFKNSIGLGKETLDKVINSPFDYDKQMKVYIPRDLADPKTYDFNDEIIEFIKSFVIFSRGKTFILFTSYSNLNYVYYSIKNELQENGITTLIHGEAPRTQLINLFKNSSNPVLFGTDSFWEGVDIKGEQLSNVIIVKLPFKVPNDPVTEAIVEYIEAQGKNAFTDFQIPEAVIKLKQGVGRLIRGKDDRGTVTILDSRLVTKKYGKYFIDSLPSKNINVISKSEILKDVIKNMKGE